MLTERIVLTCMLNVQVQVRLQAVVGRGDAMGRSRHIPEAIVDRFYGYVLWICVDCKYLTSSAFVL